MPLFYLLFALIITACEQPVARVQSTWQEINGRNRDEQHLERSAVYRAKVPSGWVRHNSAPHESIVDTTKSLCEFRIAGDGGQEIRVTIHNFPAKQIAERIPPMAQVARWQRQFTRLDLSNVLAQAYGGFAGMLFEGTGEMGGEQISVLGWSMQLAPEHYYALSGLLAYTQTEEESVAVEQMRADYTIKVVGPQSLVDQHKDEIIAFAHSFELIQELPARS